MKFIFHLAVIFILLVSCEKKELKQMPISYELNVPAYFPNYKIPEDNKLTKAGVELGRHLFYEKKLSLDNSVSCSSCHKQSLAFSDNFQFSPGVGGKLGHRNSMSLANLMFLPKNFFWDGRSTSLEHQAIFPIIDPLEMSETIDNVISKLNSESKYPLMFKNAFGDQMISSDRIQKALAQFQRTLISSNSKYDKFKRGEVKLTAQEMLGLELFYIHPDGNLTPPIRGGNCGDCHAGELQTDNSMKNNGLDTDASLTDKGLENVTGFNSDRGKFRLPSLRNIELTAPYMHDGRFATLEDVMQHYNEGAHFGGNTDVLMNASNASGSLPQNLQLSPTEVAAIIAFLKTLTDHDFVSNPKFSEPK